MKNIRNFLFASVFAGAVFAVSAVCSWAGPQQQPSGSVAADAALSLPEVVTRGFEQYARSGAEAALQAWVAGGPLQSDEFVSSQAGGLHRIEVFFGKYQGYDLIRVSPVTARLKAVYTVLNFEKGPAFCYMLCYQTSGGGWVVSDFDGSTSPRRILPEYGAGSAPLPDPAAGQASASAH